MSEGLRNRNNNNSNLVDMADVRRLTKEGRVCMVVGGRAYDFTDFAVDHPGGRDQLDRNVGKDATNNFEDNHPVDIIEQTLTKEQMAAMDLGPVDPKTIKLSDIADEYKEEKSEVKSIGEKPTIEQCINLYDFEAIAKNIIPKQGWLYYSSAADDEITLRENTSAFHRIWLRPRVMVNVRDVDVSTTLFGHPVSMPLTLCAAAMAKLGHPEGEVAWIKAAGVKNIIYAIPTLSGRSFNDIIAAKTDGQPSFFQLYVNQDREKTKKLVQRAEAGGCNALFITVDAPQLGNRERDRRTKVTHAGAAVQGGKGGPKNQGTAKALTTFIDPSLSWDDLPWFRSITKMKLVLKGIATVEDTIMALEKGCDGVILSNHGGRQLDFARSGIEILTEVMPTLRKHPQYSPDTFEVHIDGGIRRGTDIFKALALGATAVGVGRPGLYSMAAFGQAGVEKMIQILKDELEMTMRLMGCRRLADIKPEMVITENLNTHIAVVPSHNLYNEVYRPKKTQAGHNSYGVPTLRRPIATGVTAKPQGKPQENKSNEKLLTGAVGGVLIESAIRSITKSFLTTLDPRQSLHRSAIFLLAYLYAHLGCNLLFLVGKDLFNTNVHYITNHPLVKFMEYYLALAFIFHACMGIFLTIRTKKYAATKKISCINNAKLILSGTVIIGLVVHYLIHFRFADKPISNNGITDYYQHQLNVFAGISGTFNAIIYLISVIALGIHLWYGWPKTVRKFELTGPYSIYIQPLQSLGQTLILPLTVGFIVCIAAAWGYTRI